MPKSSEPARSSTSHQIQSTKPSIASTYTPRSIETDYHQQQHRQSHQHHFHSQQTQKQQKVAGDFRIKPGQPSSSSFPPMDYSGLGASDVPSSTQDESSYNIQYGRSTVELMKREDTTLGLSIAENPERDEPPIVADIRHGSSVDNSDSLLVGDRIVAINRVTTRKLRHEECIHIAKAAWPWLRLDVEYELPELPPAGCTVKHMLVDLNTQLDQTSVGLVIRGGWNKTYEHIRPLTVMHVRPASEADRDGRIKPGDRILAVNNIHAGQLTSDDATKLIKSSRSNCLLLVEYNVANFDADRSVSGAIMVDIEKPGEEDLGVSLAPCHEVKTGQNAFFIDSISQGSIADRCGALFPGDRVEAIDEIHVEELTLQEAMRRLRNNGLDNVRLQIVPNVITNLTSQTKKETPAIADSIGASHTRSVSQPSSRPTSMYGTHRSPNNPQSDTGGGLSAAMDKQDSSFERRHELTQWTKGQQQLAKSQTSLHSMTAHQSHHHSSICRGEEVEVCLEADRLLGFGFTLASQRLHTMTSAAPPPPPNTSQPLTQFPIVESICVGGPAFKSGVIQEGDRVLEMNGQTTLNRSIDELSDAYLAVGRSQRDSQRLTMITQYSIADTVVPSEGVFDVKLVKCAGSLGINLQASISKHDNQPLLISKVMPGSVASRSGSISPGDVLLAVNGISLSSCILADAIRLLQSPFEDYISLRIQKSPSVDHQLAQTSTHRHDDRRHHHRRADSNPESSSNQGDQVEQTDRSLPRKAHPTESGYLPNYADLPSQPHSSDTLDEDARLSNQAHSLSPPSCTAPPPSHHPPGQLEDRHSPYKQADNRRRELTKSSRPCRSPKDIRRRLAKLLQELSIDQGVKITSVIITRKSPDYPWGIIICGTDETPNAPVFIDSLSQGDSGQTSGLLQPNDRIVAINGNSLHSTNTLSQAMRLLQHYPDRVELCIARLGSTTTPHHPPVVDLYSDDQQPTSSDQSQAMVSNQSHYRADPSSLRRRISLKKTRGVSTFSRSFESASGDGTAGNSSESNPTDCQQTSNRDEPLRHHSHTIGRLPVDLSPPNQRQGETCRLAPMNDLGARTYGQRTGVKAKFQVHTTLSPVGAYSSTLPGKMTAGDDIGLGVSGTYASTDNRLLPPTPDQHQYRQHHHTSRLLGRHSYVATSGDPECEEDEVPSSSGGSGCGGLSPGEVPPLHPNFQLSDLDEIQCPGCRVAIMNELKQQQQRQTVIADDDTDGDKRLMRSATESKRSLERGQVDQRRARSQQRSHEVGVASRTFYDNQTSRPVPFDFAPRHTDSFDRPNAGHSSTTEFGMLFRHSRSDSRLNLLDTSSQQSAAYNKQARTSKDGTRTLPPPQRSEFDSPQSGLSMTTSKNRTIGTIPFRIQTSGDNTVSSRHNQSSSKPSTPPLVSQRRPYRSQSYERRSATLWIRLAKASPSDSYGIGVSEGLSTRGIFVSAIRPNSSADRSRQLHLYDRIIMVNDVPVKDLTCSNVVGLISQSVNYVDLLVQRRVCRTKSRHNVDPTGYHVTSGTTHIVLPSCGGDDSGPSIIHPITGNSASSETGAGRLVRPKQAQHLPSTQTTQQQRPLPKVQQRKSTSDHHSSQQQPRTTKTLPTNLTLL